MNDKLSYNDRIFSKGVRSRLHYARFYWLREKTKKWWAKPASILELGCFDAKTISFLDPKPIRYSGYDANWENGLDIAKTAFENPAYQFFECSLPEQLNPSRDTFDLVICMETLEHLPDDTLDEYLSKLKDAVGRFLFITIPNETGIIFLGKYLVKTLFFREKMNPTYSLGEVLSQTFGKMEQVKHDDHKGFDYRRLVNQLRQDWEILEINAIPFGWLPTFFGFSVGVVARPKGQ